MPKHCKKTGAKISFFAFPYRHALLHLKLIMERILAP
jgi:hypothetical protein